MNDETHPSHDHPNKPGSGPLRWAFLGFLAVALFFLLTEHRAHALGFLPFLLLLLCPLLHFFGHGGHGDGKPGEGGHRHE